MKSKKIYIAGHTGMVGSALKRRLKEKGYSKIIGRTRDQLDLLDQQAVFDFMHSEKPDFVIIAAAKVGGIQANNTFRYDFIFENLMVQTNIVNAAIKAGITKLCFLGSSCIYPRECPQPMCEDQLLSGPLETTNEPYAIAKIAGIKLCESANRQFGSRFFSVIPCNLYGPNDNYDLTTSHVIPALIRKAHLAKEENANELVVWGTGRPLREFLYVDDAADAIVFLLEKSISNGIFNIGYGSDVSIKELAQIVVDVVGFRGKLVFDASKPDGTPRKLLNVELLSRMGWEASTCLHQGIEKAYAAFLSEHHPSKQ